MKTGSGKSEAIDRYVLAKGRIMAKQQELEVQQGIWIDMRWLHQAGLTSHCQIEIKPGEIRIVEAGGDTIHPAPTEKDWDVLRSLGSNAEPGRLPDAAVEHDRYLYGKGR